MGNCFCHLYQLVYNFFWGQKEDKFKKLDEERNSNSDEELIEIKTRPENNFINLKSINEPEQKSDTLEEYKRQMEERIRQEREKIERLKQMEIDKGNQERLRSQQELKELDEKFEQELNDMKREQERRIQELKERQRNRNIPDDTAQKQMEELIAYYKQKEREIEERNNKKMKELNEEENRMNADHRRQLEDQQRAHED